MSYESAATRKSGYQLLIVFIATLLLVLIPLKGAACAAESGERAIQQKIERRIAVEEGRSGSGIDVKVEGGIALLTGTVPTLMQKERIRRLAEHVSGVRAVINTIAVESTSRADEAIREDVRRRLLQALPGGAGTITVAVDDAEVILAGSVASYAAKQLAGGAAMSVRGVGSVVNDVAVVTGTRRRDRDIERDVLLRLAADILVESSTIDVAVNDGRVTLAGVVATPAEKRRAADDAWLPGVTAVDTENLTVNWSAAVQGRRSTPYIRQDDAAIDGALEKALQLDPRVNAFNVSVSVVNGVVTLSGVVDTLYASRAAEDDARGTTGVWRVDNQLRLRHQPFPRDTIVKDRIEDVFDRDAELHSLGLHVAVSDNYVTLTGTVDSLIDKIRAGDIASQIAGVAWLDNQITVRSAPEAASSDRDAALSGDITAELEASPVVDSQRIRVVVQDGRAVLKGTAADPFVVHSAVQKAFEAGATSVRTRIILDDGSTFTSRFEKKETMQAAPGHGS